jgi:hypothetical protein
MTAQKFVLAFVAVASLYGDQKKLTNDQHMEILRGLSAEYATARVPLPRSKKPLNLQTDGTFDTGEWTTAQRQFGPAARLGDLVQVTKVDIEKDTIILQINGGMRAKGAWKDHVSVGMGGPVGMNPVNGGNPTNAPGGTTIALRFNSEIGEVTSADIKKMLKPVLDFNQQSATEQFAETLKPEVKKAVADKHVIVGMTRDEVLLAVGKPLRKDRETADGVESEDWIYGTPPGRVTFVTFQGAKVVKVKDTYAGLGGTIADTPKQQ